MAAPLRGGRLLDPLARRLRRLWSGDLRRRWDQWAREDPIFWSVVRAELRGSQDAAAAFAEGQADALALLRPALAQLRFDPAGRRLLDLGAGFGRMFPGYAKLGFETIVGAEVSLEMARHGMHWRAVPDARFVVVDGLSLAPLRDACFDFCVSRGVLPYQPHERRVWRLVREVHRVLAPGGACLLHVGGRLPSAATRLRRLLPARGRGRERGLTLAVPEERFVARMGELGFRDVSVLPDARRGRRREHRYYVLARRPA